MNQNITNPVKQLREKLGIDQDDLSILLKVSRSYISMVESGKRILPTKALLIFAQLEKVMNKNISSKNSQSKELVQKRESIRKDLIKRKLAKKKHEIIKVENELQYALNQEVKMLEITNALPEIEKIIGKNDLTIIKHRQSQRLNKYNPGTILKLEFRIKALQAEIKFLENNI